MSQDCYLEEEIDDWLEYLKEKEEEQVIENIKRCSMTGRPCGHDLFIKKLEKLSGRRLRALSRGKPHRYKWSLSLFNYYLIKKTSMKSVLMNYYERVELYLQAGVSFHQKLIKFRTDYFLMRQIIRKI